jgi:malonyl-CoA O-methyltransferase
LGIDRRTAIGKSGRMLKKAVVTCVAMTMQDLQRRFDRAAETFDSADFVHAVTRDGLLDRLEPMTVSAATILDLGSATGASARALRQRFRRAVVIAVDISLSMLERSARGSGWFRKQPAVQADAAQLPLADHSVDLVFSNLLLPWVDQRDRVFAEVARVLRKEGLFVFSTLGPDSLAGLRHAPFADMHDVGDELVRSGLRDPVLDVDRLTVNYSDKPALARDLAAIGAGGCMPPDIDHLDVELELVYGHCWGAGLVPARGEFRIDSVQIGRRNK